MFQGATQLSLDSKGRLAVPSSHREALQVQAEGRLVVTAHPHGCLLLYARPAWEPIRGRIMGYSSFDRQTSMLQRLLVGFAKDVDMDAAGRVLLAPELRRYAALDKQVMLVGQGSHFEIWSAEAWDRQLEQIVAQGDSLLPPGMENFSL
ncbi:MAG TPA: division/cell wall cluster transcriptional repressor MraZ [Burkholderiales bacterium]|nr:division/cell wall cluster transcriptional repressor MraZ [Burkholderiales bacterium]